MAQTILIHYLETGERLFGAIYVRTSDVVSDGDRVYLGHFGQDGVLVDYLWDRPDSNIGLAESRKLS
ncbi:MAG: hypothetical protein U0516_02615 [Candidatus Saccharibacteria bacterium]